MAVLGSTGSIGVNTLNIAREYKLDIDVLVAGNNIELLKKQIDEFAPQIVVVGKKEHVDKITHKRVLWGEEGILEAIESTTADTVVNALVGFLGLRPTVKAIECGKRVALANKESLVVAGKFIDISKIDPIDSEHFGLWYILGKRPVKSMLITASGGAFRDWPLEKLERATLEDALKHPNWSMGVKITIDSATMVNKLFELLEGRWLFGCQNLDAVIETKSIIHAIVNYMDGSSVLHAAYADMRLPIAFALLKEVKKPVMQSVDFASLGILEFRKIEQERYPVWQIREELLEQPHRGIVVNAANEVAIEAFVNRQAAFTKISEVILKSFEKFSDVDPKNLEEVFEIDKEVRNFARSLIG
ncbi:1-deoxy-D-xylulose-5-phosphate reductoisomerase [Nitrosophilus alvini]|uniref:1-deoxy-D-xylulose-5-phosphate reductoisomerase n=1 Tax=Nitrosophilus alvini TaxID=2714855 RepID=UPI00190D0248